MPLDPPDAEEATVVARGSLGEYRIGLMLQHCGPQMRTIARNAAAGWGNDHYVVASDPRTQRASLQWVTRWDTVADAQAFHLALHKAARCYPKAASVGLHIREETGIAIAGDRVSYVRGVPGAAVTARSLLK
jgi:hypothetical protein